MNRRNPRIVLVRPRNPVNIGAVARGMANFSFADLVVVSPHPPVWEEARRAALGAGDVLKAARVAGSLAEAVADCALVVGTTSGARRKLDRELVPPAVLRPRGRTALVFGPEKTGLTNEELSYCHQLVRIPTTAATPSMNVAQAVAVCCYELRRARPTPGPSETGARAGQPARNAGSQPPAPAPAGELVRLLELAAPLLEAAGFFDTRTRAARLRKLRRILLGANLSREDVALLTAAVRQLAYKIGTDT